MDKVYIICPHCGKKLFRVDNTSVYKNIYIWCKYCKKEIKLTEPKSQER